MISLKSCKRVKLEAAAKIYFHNETTEGLRNGYAVYIQSMKKET